MDATLQRITFRSQNLLATVLPPSAPLTSDPDYYTTCPSGTCCGPPSAFPGVDCHLSQLVPRDPGLSAADLTTLVADLRTKMNVERRGLDVVLAAKTNGQFSVWRDALQGIFGDPWAIPR